MCSDGTRGEIDTSETYRPRANPRSPTPHIQIVIIAVQPILEPGTTRGATHNTDICYTKRNFNQHCPLEAGTNRIYRSMQPP